MTMKIWSCAQPDYIFYNGEVHTVNSTDHVASAVAVVGNHIMATGGDAEIRNLAAEETRQIDLTGRSVIPGIIDAHGHAVETGIFLEGLLVNGMPSIKEMMDRVEEKLADMDPGAWLQGGCWIETQFAEDRMPTRHDLDPVSPDHPVVIERIFAACVANTHALQLAGITRETPDPPGGVIERDPKTGEPTGILQRSAKSLLRKVMPTGTDTASLAGGTVDEIESLARVAMKELVKYGITGTVEAGVGPEMCRAYQNLKSRDELLLRVALMPNWYGFTLTQNMEQMARFIDEFGFYTGYGDDWVRLSGLKMAIDGGLTSKTALKSWEYLGGDPAGEIPLRLDLNKLDGWVKEAHDANWSVGIHVMGDIAIEKAVNAIHRAFQANPAPRQHQLVHAYYPSADSLDKMREVGVVVAVQPAFIYGEADGYPQLLPEDKQEQFLPLRTYIDAGVTIAASSDTPCAHYNPFWGLYSAVTRKGMQGYQLGTAEAISVPEMLRAMTMGGAILTGEQDNKGSLEPGKLADLVVLDRNLRVTPDESLRDLEVDLTMVDGRVVYRKGE